MEEVEIRVADTEQDFDRARILFLDYAGTYGLDLDYLGFDFELGSLEHIYKEPEGLLFLCTIEDEEIGFLAMAKKDNQVAEINRLYLSEDYRSKENVTRLLRRAVQHARQVGYVKIVGHFVQEMSETLEACAEMGFLKTNPYRRDLLPDSLFLEYNLK